MTENKGMLKEISMIGMVQLIRLAIGLIRNKMIALYFGANGLGVWALFLTFTEMCQQFISMGLDKSAVKDISVNNTDLIKQENYIKLLQICLLINSMIVFTIVVIASEYIDVTFFKTQENKTSIYIALYVLLNCNSICFSTIFNGMRETKLYSYAQLNGVIIGNLIIFTSIPFVQINQLVFLFLIQAIINFLVHFYYYFKLKLTIKNLRFEFSLRKDEIFRFLSSGTGFWIPGIYLAFSEYVIRVYISNTLDNQVVGIYQACWTISNMYVGIILSSMAVSFYPRICQIIKNNKKVNTILNHQVNLGLAMSIPFLLVIFLFSDYILIILYSAEFESGKEIIQWQIIGVILRLMGFAFGYALMAKGETKKYIVSQFIFITINMLLTIYIVKYMDVNSLGVSYLVSYSIYFLLIFYFSYKVFGFSFKKETINKFLMIVVFFCISTCFVMFLNGFLYMFLSAILILLSAYISYGELKNKHGFELVNCLKGKLR